MNFAPKAGPLVAELLSSVTALLIIIYETCRYKAVSFLGFLLSKERDIDSYADRL